MDAGALARSNERQLQGAFLESVFNKLLGYWGPLAGRSIHTLNAEPRTETDATEPDGALGWFSPTSQKVFAVIELKDARTNLDRRQLSRPDRLTPVDQAFLYSTKFSGCEWVIVSNFTEIRLYSSKHGQTLYESFSLGELADDDRRLDFVALLAPHALSSALLPMIPATCNACWSRSPPFATAISRTSSTGTTPHSDCGSSSTSSSGHARRPCGCGRGDAEALDRVLFICFAEDTRSLLPPNLLADTAENARRSRSRSDEGSGRASRVVP